MLFLYLALLAPAFLITANASPMPAERAITPSFTPLSLPEATSWLTQALVKQTFNATGITSLVPATLTSLLASLDLAAHKPIEWLPSPYTFTTYPINGVETLVDVSLRGPSDSALAALHETFAPSSTKRDCPCLYAKSYGYDTSSWGYWNPSWSQVGGCFYCDDCSWSIQKQASVQQSWTASISGDFTESLKWVFGFSREDTQGIATTQTCEWSSGQEYGCHSIWYQPLMTYHDGNARVTYSGNACCRNTFTNYQAAHVDQSVANNGVNTGNTGCNSGCQGSDHRQCQYQNDGGLLWPLSD